MMVKVLIYGYATGVFSSRRIARKLEDDVAFRMLAAGNFPQHRTICEFQRRHLEGFRRLFVEVVRVAREMGLARFGKLSIDGTKVRANASKRKAMSYERMLKEEVRLKGEIAALVAKAGAVDTEEDERYGEDVRGDELPEERNAERSGCKRFGRPGSGWRRRNERPTTHAGASPARTATPWGASPTSATMANPPRRRRATSPTPRAGS